MIPDRTSAGRIGSAANVAGDLNGNVAVFPILCAGIDQMPEPEVTGKATGR